MLCGPYTAYPAATCCDPACRKSFSSTSRPDAWCGACNTEKLVPMETLTWIFDEPSRGVNSSKVSPLGERLGMRCVVSISSDAIGDRWPLNVTKSVVWGEGGWVLVDYVV